MVEVNLPIVRHVHPALTGFIIDHEQVVDFHQGARRLSRARRPSPFCPAYQTPAPAVRGGVANGAERRA